MLGNIVPNKMKKERKTKKEIRNELNRIAHSM